MGLVKVVDEHNEFIRPAINISNEAKGEVGGLLKTLKDAYAKAEKIRSFDEICK
jgi:hypothetical protein